MAEQEDASEPTPMLTRVAWWTGWTVQLLAWGLLGMVVLYTLSLELELNEFRYVGF